MHVDHDALARIQEYRICADPIIDFRGSVANASLEDTIYSERDALVEKTPPGERVATASWGELAAFCSTASLTTPAFVNESFLRLFQLVLRKTTATMTGGGTDANLPSNIPNLPPSDATHERASALREALKRDRDRWFLDAVDSFDLDTNGVPDAFWLHATADEATAGNCLIAWFASGDVPDSLAETTPAPPKTATDRDQIADNAMADRDSTQAGLGMF